MRKYNFRIGYKPHNKPSYWTTINLCASEPKYRCPKCGGGMCKDLTIVFLTHLEAMKEYRDILESRNYLEKVW